MQEDLYLPAAAWWPGQRWPLLSPRWPLGGGDDVTEAGPAAGGHGEGPQRRTPEADPRGGPLQLGSEPRQFTWGAAPERWGSDTGKETRPEQGVQLGF